MQLGAVDFNQIVVLNSLHVVYLVGDHFDMHDVVRSKLDLFQRHWLACV